MSLKQLWKRYRYRSNRRDRRQSRVHVMEGLENRHLLTATIFIDDASASEGANEVFRISLSEASATDVTVQYATWDGSAIGQLDYVAESGTVTIPAGLTEVNVEVETLVNPLADGDKEFTVTQ